MTEPHRKRSKINFIIVFFAIISFLAFIVELFRSSTAGFIYFITALILFCIWKIGLVDRDDVVLEICKKVVIATGTTSVLAAVAFCFRQPVSGYIVEKEAEGQALGAVYELQLQGKHDEVMRATDSTVINKYPPSLKIKLNKLRTISADAATVAVTTAPNSAIPEN